MSDQPPRYDAHPWNDMTPNQVLSELAQELYTPVSLLSSHLNHLTCDDDMLTEDEMESILNQMQIAVRQLSKTVVNLKRYAQDQDRESASSPPSAQS